MKILNIHVQASSDCNTPFSSHLTWRHRTYIFNQAVIGTHPYHVMTQTNKLWNTNINRNLPRSRLPKAKKLSRSINVSNRGPTLSQMIKQALTTNNAPLIKISFNWSSPITNAKVEHIYMRLNYKYGSEHRGSTIITVKSKQKIFKIFLPYYTSIPSI